MMLLLRVDAMPWQNLSLVFVSSRLSLEMFNAELQRTINPSKRLIVELRSFNSNKIKTYKKQIEEAEEIAALNLAKYRKAQQGLEEAEDRSKIAGNQLSLVRAASI